MLNAPLGKSFGLKFRAAAGMLCALVLAGCATAPRAAPINQALVASAHQGNPRAEFALGGQILARARSPAERAVGVGWVRKAAEADLASAQYQLGWMYLTGRDVPQDTATALQWVSRAAKHGAPAAQLRLGQLYAVGDLVPLDKVQAYYWYSVAAKPTRSDVTIMNIEQVRKLARRNARALAPSLTAAQRASVDQQVAAWTTTPGVPYSGSVMMASFIIVVQPPR
jgi:TPR repeat protein